VADVVQRLKEGTSWVILKKFLELGDFFGENNFCLDSDFADTVGNVDEEAVRRYIRESRRYACQIMIERLKSQVCNPRSSSFYQLKNNLLIP